jgi:hypothetical protein
MLNHHLMTAFGKSVTITAVNDHQCYARIDTDELDIEFTGGCAADPMDLVFFKTSNNTFSFNGTMSIETADEDDIKEDVPPCDVYDDRHEAVFALLEKNAKKVSYACSLTTTSVVIQEGILTL